MKTSPQSIEFSTPCSFCKPQGLVGILDPERLRDAPLEKCRGGGVINKKQNSNKANALEEVHKEQKKILAHQMVKKKRRASTK